MTGGYLNERDNARIYLVKKLIYLAGPMAGMPDHNYPTFDRVSKVLREQGFEVISPAELNPDTFRQVEAGEILESVAWIKCIRKDIAALAACEAIAYLPGWENSRGATFEMMVAEMLDLEFIDIKSIDPVMFRLDYPPIPGHIIRRFLRVHEGVAINGGLRDYLK